MGTIFKQQKVLRFAQKVLTTSLLEFYLDTSHTWHHRLGFKRKGTLCKILVYIKQYFSCRPSPKFELISQTKHLLATPKYCTLSIMSDLVNPIAILSQSDGSEAWKQFIENKIVEFDNIESRKLLFSVFGEIHLVPELSKSCDDAKPFWNFPYSVNENICYPTMSYAARDKNQNFYAVRIYNNPERAEAGNAFLADLRSEYTQFQQSELIEA